MNLLNRAFADMGTVLLPLAAALLFEELTVGGLVRLLFAPRPEAGKQKGLNYRDGDGKCSH